MMTSSSSPSIWQPVYSLIGGEEKQKEWYEEIQDDFCSFCPSLTFQQRISGCVICLVLGFLLSLGSTMRLVTLLRGHPESFAIMYTVGNVLGMSSTCFLFGPASQFKKMFAATRVTASIIYFVMMGLTLFVAFYPGDIPVRGLILVLLIFLQFCALSWYTLSFIPFGREVVGSCLMRCCCGSPAAQASNDWSFV